MAAFWWLLYTVYIIQILNSILSECNSAQKYDISNNDYVETHQRYVESIWDPWNSKSGKTAANGCHHIFQITNVKIRYQIIATPIHDEQMKRKLTCL